MTLQELRKKRNLPQSKLASMVGISVTALSMIECGHAVPRYSTISKLENALNAQITYTVIKVRRVHVHITDFENDKDINDN